MFEMESYMPNELFAFFPLSFNPLFSLFFATLLLGIGFGYFFTERLGTAHGVAIVLGIIMVIASEDYVVWRGLGVTVVAVIFFAATFILGFPFVGAYEEMQHPPILKIPFALATFILGMWLVYMESYAIGLFATYRT